MVFGFKFVKCLRHSIPHINSQVVKIWRIWRPFILYNDVCTVDFQMKMENSLGILCKILHNFIKLKIN